MKEKFSIKNYLLFLLIAALLCLACIFGMNKLQERKNGKQLQILLSELTYQPGENSEEIKILEEFAPELEHISQKNQALYYRAMTKLYMLRGDMDQALLNFVDSEIHAEISKAYDVAAWLYLDAAQVYVDLGSNTTALDCINTAIEYGEMQPMEEFFYEYAYLLKAEMEAALGKTEKAQKSYEKSLEYSSAEDLPEYHSIELRQKIVMAAIMLRQGNLKKAGGYVEELEQEIQHLEEVPTDSMWFSSVYYPYLTIQTKYALQQGYYEKVPAYIDETFATGVLYGQFSSLISFLNDILSFTETIEEPQLSAQLSQKIQTNIQKLILEYPDAFQNKNNIAATHIYNSNMITIAVFVQKYRTEQLYRRIAQGAAAVVLIIAVLLTLIRRTEYKGRIDGLTGAYIRRYFNEVYEKLKNGNTEFGIIMYDIDFFKQINDKFGHDAGDWALRATARQVMSLLDRNCSLFRYGGDEFCVICKKKSLEEMAALAENIRSSVEKMDWKEGMNVSFSMGVAAASQSPERDVMAKADEKLYASKEAGRNCVSW